MHQITREQFRIAIEAGLDAASQQPNNMPDHFQVALRRLGDTATEIGTNFMTEPGCPLTCVGAYRVEDSDGDPWIAPADAGRAFYDAYDSAMIDGAVMWALGDVVTVTG